MLQTVDGLRWVCSRPTFVNCLLAFHIEAQFFRVDDRHGSLGISAVHEMTVGVGDADRVDSLALVLTIAYLVM